MSFEGQDRRGGNYRGEVDGLRAIAVIAVMAFHARLQGFGGGYTGVDIFFVISGYLITGIIAREIEHGHFTFRAFYLRRVLRILPALLFVLTACVPLALLVPDPALTKTFGSALAAALAFCANFYFWSIPAGYFAPQVHDIPLVHLWSLAVEEQFYLIYPLALAILYKFARRWLVAFIVTAATASLGLSEFASLYMPSANFFMLPTRAWEMLAGATVALTDKAWRGVLPKWVDECMAAGALAVIGWTIWTYTSNTRFPGLSALPVVLATMLLLRFARPDGPVGALLGSAPLRGIGVISYSAYLWHQPLLAFSRISLINDVGATASSVLLLLAFVLAWGTWHFVEVPFRRDPRLRRPRVLFAGVALGAALFATGVGFWMSNGVPQRFDDRHLKLMAMGRVEAERELPCFFTPGSDRSFEQSCAVGEGDPAKVAVLGDSHAAAIMPAVESAVSPHKSRAIFLIQSGCPPVLTMPQPDVWYGHCAAFNRRAFAWLAERPDIGTVLLAARWTYYLERRWANNGEGGVEHGQTVQPAPDATRQAMARAYRTAVETLLAQGKRVILVYPVPEAGWHVPSTIAKRELGGVAGPLTVDAAWVRARNAGAVSALDEIGEQPGLIRIHPEEKICGALAPPGRCLLQLGPTPLYFDDDHPSPAGARIMLLPQLTTALAAADARDDRGAPPIFPRAWLRN